MHPAALIGTLASLTLILTLLAACVRAIFNTIARAEANEKAITILTASVGKLTDKEAEHDTRLAVLENGRRFRDRP